MDSDSEISIGGLSDASSSRSGAAPKKPVPAITARNKPTRPRFLGDGDDSGGEEMTVFGGPRIGGRGGAAGKESTREREERSEIDAMFDDLEDDLELPPELDLDPIAGPETTIDPLRANPDAEDPTAGGDGKAPRKKRVIVKLDEDRLLGDDGIPKLITLCKAFKPKGKGKEVEDLKRLLKMYQLWAHQMYPKTNFVETVETIENVCRKRRMQSALKDWRAEAHGYSNKKSKTGAADDAALPAALDGAADPEAAARQARAEDGEVDFSHDPDGELFDDSIFDDFDLDALNDPPTTVKAKPPPAGPKPLFAPPDADEARYPDPCFGDMDERAAAQEREMEEMARLEFEADMAELAREEAMMGDWDPYGPDGPSAAPTRAERMLDDWDLYL